MNAELILAYCRGFWAAIAGQDCSRAPKSWLRTEWFYGYDDGCMERLRHEDSLKPKKPVKKVKLRLPMKPQPGERYVQTRLRQIAKEQAQEDNLC